MGQENGIESVALEIVTQLCLSFEGVILTPYLCPAGLATIGVGATRYPSGSAVTLSDSAITREVAEFILKWQLTKKFIPGVLALCPDIDTSKRLAAITDFAFNCGLGRLKTSTLRKRINEGAWDQVPIELKKWTIGGGRRLQGLVMRRDAEAALVC